MKKIHLSLVVLLFVLSSCAGIRYQIGQSSNDFLTTNRKHSFDLVKQSAEWTIYKSVNNWSYDPPYFFYFHYDKLYQIDKGVKSPDLIIENR